VLGQSSHSLVRVTQNSHNHTRILLSHKRHSQPGEPGPRIYILQEQGEPLCPSHWVLAIAVACSFVACARNVKKKHLSSVNNDNKDISTILDKFLDDFKSMFNQLIQQHSMVLNMLTMLISRKNNYISQNCNMECQWHNTTQRRAKNIPA
jgi:hypothetical protein